MELEHQQECERLETSLHQLKTQLEGLQLEVTDKQVTALNQAQLIPFHISLNTCQD